MRFNTEILKSSSFVLSELAILAISTGTIILFPGSMILSLLFFVAASAAAYIIIQQQQKIASLQADLNFHLAKEDEFALRTEQLRRALHDVRSPLTALGLRLQMLRKSGCEANEKHLSRLQSSLETAIEQVLTMSDIQKGKVKPTATMEIHIEELRAHLMKSQ